ncbi:ribonuclease R [Streptococcus ovuberis]|uniref:Ribonuclease R n=1 Tax=Streptococcus ovuberis TaxID=1936207 RepID=A0A7X6MXE1_9STRE|nr:ribonuclease R [Streptococcus ovuberis]NKZ19258.1 ribonuclease R [Streptococcus ovuberis]
MKKQIIAYLKEAGPVTMTDLSQALGIDTASDFKHLVKSVSNLEHKKEIEFYEDGRVALKVRHQSLTLKGRFSAHKNGFGFVSLSDGSEELFIGRNDVGHAIDGDLVELIITKPANRLKGTVAEGRIIDVIERQLTTAVGAVVLDDEKSDFIGYIRSKNQKISQLIYLRPTALIMDGTEVVKVDIVDYPSAKRDFFVAEIRDIIGRIDDPGIDVLEVLESMEIVSSFPDAVLQEAQAIAEAPTEEDLIGRLDLRGEVTFTIDGADAKDLDDAVHIKQLPNGNFELGVHIADVSYYVTEGSALDQEALRRGTSVYVTDRVVPMLPERLSNGICSLNPQVDRLTQSAIMEINAKGQVVNYQLAQSVIKTTYRMTYGDVNDMLAGDSEKLERYAKIAPSVKDMAELHTILETMRYRRGALNFDTKEAKILVNALGKPVDIALRQRGIAERMIESFMLVANETVAEHFARLNLPFIYRIHEEPKAEKLQTFIDYASIFGIPIRGTAAKISQEALQDVMAKVAGQPNSEVLSMMLLRSMQQARYSEENHGHYGLAAEFYTHFTSPIRRYPDLMVHRMLRDYMRGTKQEVAEHFAGILPEIASESSRLERRAVDAEREVEAMKKAEFMTDYVGEVFDGVVSSIAKFGLFVELPNTVEGLIHVTNLPEYFQYHERTLTLQGERTGLVFKVGQPIRVRVTKADKATGEIDFEWVASELDWFDKPQKALRDKPKPTRKRASKERQVSSKKKSHSTKGKKPFYKEVAKKGGQHGKGRRKARRAK